jgi:hypothetical protein
MFYVVSAPDRTDYQFERGRLITLLQRDWPGIVVGGPRGQADRDVVWTYRDPDGEIDGSQNRAGQAQYLEGPLPLVARFAAWLRHQVPAEQALMLYDESYSTLIPLSPHIDEHQILQRLLS